MNEYLSGSPALRNACWYDWVSSAYSHAFGFAQESASQYSTDYEAPKDGRTPPWTEKYK